MIDLHGTVLTVPYFLYLLKDKSFFKTQLFLPFFYMINIIYFTENNILEENL